MGNVSSIREVQRTQEALDSLGRDSSAVRSWIIQGDATESEQYVALVGGGYVSLVISTADGLTPLIFQSLSRRQLGPYVWEWVAKYIDQERKNEKQKASGSSCKLDFDTTGATTTIKQSKATVGSWKKSTLTESAPNFRGAVNVNGGNVEGAQVTIPALKFSLTFKHELGIVTPSYMKTVSRLTGTSNDAPFWEFDEGEVLFLGARGSDGTDAPAEITYNFEASENIVAWNMGGVGWQRETGTGTVNGIDKKGHDFLWVRYEPTVDPSSGKLIPAPLFVYVERLYNAGDFTELRIPQQP